MVELYVTQEDPSLIQVITQYAERYQHEVTVIKDDIPTPYSEQSLIITTDCSYAEQAPLPTLLCSDNMPVEGLDHLEIVSFPLTMDTLVGTLDRLIIALSKGTYSSGRSEDGMVIGPYTLDANARLLVCNEPNLFSKNDTIHLTEKETCLLAYLYRCGSDESVSAATLLKEIWGYHSAVDTRTLQTHIYRLRKKIDPVDSEMSLILTDPTGYRIR